MTTGYILILAILILGGVLATAGDRIGTRVGKARLSLFNLRPRKTAVLITILTGSLISASTLAILLIADKQLRTGVFELEEIQQDLSRAREDLQQTRSQKQQVEQTLDQARSQQIVAQQRLKSIEQSLQATLGKLSQALQQQARTEAQLQQTQAQLQQLDVEKTRAEAARAQAETERQRAETERARAEAERERTKAQLRQTQAQKQSLSTEIDTLQAERQDLIRQKQQVQAQIAQRDAEIEQNQQQLEAQRQKLAQQERQLLRQSQQLAQREVLLEQLTNQQNYLERQIASLERDFQSLRQGSVAVRRGQVLASGVVRVLEPDAAPEAVDRLLREANRTAIAQTRPGEAVDRQVVQITRAEVERLIEQIRDGQDYVVRILAAGNYILGEQNVQVFADAIRNQVVFEAGEVVAETSVDPSEMSEKEILQRLDFLIEASRFRARRNGILAERVQIGDGRPETTIAFVEQLREYDRSLDIQAIAQDLTYTAEPLRIELSAVRDGEVVFRTE